MMMMSFFVRVFLILLFPGMLLGNGELHDHRLAENQTYENNNHGHDDENEDEDGDVDGDGDGNENINENGLNIHPIVLNLNHPVVEYWYQGKLDQDVKWSLGVESYEYRGHSGIQYLTMLTTKQFGKAMTIDGLLQTTWSDEYIFHENLVHPALLIHDGPKTVFIMGGGSGSAAREVLKHKNIEKVIICEVDRVVYDLCLEHMPVNNAAFRDERVHVVFNDAKVELNRSEEKFDVIVGDVCDPHRYSPYSNNLYTKSFYEDVVRSKLKANGIFVTQAGPAGLLSHKAVFSPIYNTIKQVFTHVIAYTAHIPSYGDSCGFIMASNVPISINADLLDIKIGERIIGGGELKYIDGPVFAASTVFHKTLKISLMEESRVLTEENVGLVGGRPRNPLNDPLFNY